ncbi:MAG: sodium-dependent transporter [Desulfobulbaceae bacterium DB1]|nr:MAG: sodium-dependent transporter [Desulfobulbaceae bacterium DB1]
MTDSAQRALWGSKLGFLLAAIGSAIGLGNIWRFSYMTFEHGGGAFLIPYLCALLLAGIPLMILEYALGHREKGSSPLAFTRVSSKWEWAGWWMPTVALFGIMLYYAVIIGWCINYFFFSFNLAWGADPQAFFFNSFLQLSDSPFHLGGIRIPILSSTFVVWFLCWIICYREVNHGIEKACTIFMPILFLLTFILVGWTLTLDGAIDGIRNFYLSADWDKINIFKNFDDPDVWSVWTAAFGQIFFTLSLGFGIMITYASYLPKKTDIVGNAVWTAVINCTYSFIAGFAVFGIVGFMAHVKGVGFSEVIKGGPQLAFVVYPEAIRQLPFGQSIFGVIFFFVLIVAGLSSGISLVEALTCAITDKFSWTRKITVSVICLLGFLGSIIFTTRAGMLILDITDHFITNYGLIMGGIFECYLVGWLLKARTAREHVNRAGGVRLPLLWDLCVRYFTPFVLIVIIAQAFMGEMGKAYGGYSADALILFGVGWLLLTIVVAVCFTFYPWKPETLKKKHHVQEDQLLV